MSLDDGLIWSKLAAVMDADVSDVSPLEEEICRNDDYGALIE